MFTMEIEKKALLFCFMFFSLVDILLGATYYEDGQIHEIFYPVDGPVMIDFMKPGMGTTVNWYSGAHTGTGLRKGIAAYEDSFVNIYGGTVYYILYAFQRSQVNVYGGWIGRFLDAGNSSIVNIYGGTIDGDVFAFNSATINIYGSDIQGVLRVDHDTKVLLAGGTITGSLQVRDRGVLTIDGERFQIDGNPVNYGTYDMVDFASGRITGILSSGDFLDNNFSISDTASMVLLPEPLCITILSLGGLVIANRRNRRISLNYMGLTPFP